MPEPHRGVPLHLLRIRRLGEVNPGVVVVAPYAQRSAPALVLGNGSERSLILLISDYVEQQASVETRVLEVSSFIWLVDPTMSTNDPAHYDDRGKLAGRIWQRESGSGIVFQRRNGQLGFATFAGALEPVTIDGNTFYHEWWTLRAGTTGELSVTLAYYGWVT
jgi:hypothetical protein